MYKKILIAMLFCLGEVEGRHIDRTVLETVKGPKITQLKNHQGDLRDQLVFYFSSQPHCLYIPTREVVAHDNEAIINDKGLREVSYFFPTQAMTPKEIKSYADYLENSFDESNEDKGYTVALKHDKHKKGIVIAIAFDDKRIGFQCESYTAITGEPAMRIVFVNRDSLHAINANKDRLFNTAHYKKKMI